MWTPYTANNSFMVISDNPQSDFQKVKAAYESGAFNYYALGSCQPSIRISDVRNVVEKSQGIEEKHLVKLAAIEKYIQTQQDALNKQKQLLKGLVQLSEEGAVQVFRPLINNDLIVGAVGVLQFDVVVARLKAEYNVDAIYEGVNVNTARWVSSDDVKKFEEFKRKCESNLALDGGDNLTYIAPSRVNLNLSTERYPEVTFNHTREN